MADDDATKLTDEEIVPTYAGAAHAPSPSGDVSDTSDDSGDDSGDVSDTSDTGDDSGDDSGDAA